MIESSLGSKTSPPRKLERCDRKMNVGRVSFLEHFYCGSMCVVSAVVAVIVALLAVVAV